MGVDRGNDTREAGAQAKNLFLTLSDLGFPRKPGFVHINAGQTLFFLVWVIAEKAGFAVDQTRISQICNILKVLAA